MESEYEKHRNRVKQKIGGFPLGSEEGETCSQNGCCGVMELQSAVNCSCHLNAPCGPCMRRGLECSSCHLEVEDE